MVLDTYDKIRDVLVFKNTYDDPENGQPKKYEIARTHPNAPKKFYFVHIEIENMVNLPSEGERVKNKKEATKTRQKSHTLGKNRKRKQVGVSTSKSKSAKAAELDQR